MDKPTRPLVIFGVNAVLEKLKSAPAEIFELILSDGREPRARLAPVVEEARRLGLPVRTVDPRKLDALTGGGLHQGVAAATAPYAYLPLDGLLDEMKAGPARVLALDGLTDPMNFGALLRSAEGAGVAHVIIPKDRSVSVTPVVVKASAGAVNHLKIHRVANLTRALQDLKEAGCWVVGLDAGAPETIYDRRFPDRVAIVLGSEGGGMRPLVRRQCDFLVSIPMLGRVASLNVSVAGGVFLYELARQARTAPG